MKLQLVGCSHQTAPVELRQQLAFAAEDLPGAIERLQLRFPNTEAVVLSTCNRVEVYTASEDQNESPSHEDVVQFLAEFHQLSPEEIFGELFQQSGEDAVRHLFYVAASLDSMVVGESQILGQVKQAYEEATRLGSTGPLTHGVFQAALKAARRVAADTAIHQRRISIPAVAVSDFATQIFQRFDDKNILLIGAGEMAEETLQYLRSEGAQEVTIVNRSLERSNMLAEKWQCRPDHWDRLRELIVDADLIVSTTAAGQPVVTLEDFKKIESQRHQRPLAILDLAVPCDFEPTIGKCLGVYLYNIDDLQIVCHRNRQARQDEWPAAEQILEEETRQFMVDLHHRATAPTIRQLKESCELLKAEELERLFNKIPESNLAAQEEIARAFDRFINKLLHPPLDSLRKEAHMGTPHSLLEAFKRLFKLKD
jgi:glutamyl-tRNA reductase